MKSHFRQKFMKEIMPKLAKKLSIQNRMALPRLEKIVINSGVAKIRDNQDLIKRIQSDLQKITGQKPALTKSKKAIAGFKLKQGETVGLMTTLRGDRMYDFLDKLINFALPAQRDFKGLKKKFDRQGNFNLGIREYAVFPEISFEDVSHIQSIGINFHIQAKNQSDAEALLESFGIPFKKNN